MNAVVKTDKSRDFGKWHRRAEAHDPCLLSYTCTPVDHTDDVTDNQLRWKGFLTFLDAVIDPMAGTKYVIHTQPPQPKSTGAYFYRVGRHMAWVMREPDGEKTARE